MRGLFVNCLAACVALAGGSSSSFAATPASSVSDPYIQRFLVNWRGGGHVLLSLSGSPWSVNCYFDPAPGDNAVVLSGRCSLKYLFIISSGIEAKLQYESATNSYSGTYSVDGGPPAMLSGSRNGNDLNLDVRWPQPVNGHLHSVIKIVNNGHSFTLTTIDPLGTSGTPITTSDLSFTAQ